MKTIALISAVLLVASQGAMAQGKGQHDDPRHGGVAVELGTVHLELVAKGKALTLHALTDACAICNRRNRLIHMTSELSLAAGSDGYHLLKGADMKLRNVLAATSAALIGATSVGVAQAGPRDGHRGDRHYSGDRHGGNHGYHRDDRGGSDNSLAIALGIGLIGAVIASQVYSQPRAQPYAQPYGYAPGYNNSGYQYSQPRNYWQTPQGY